MFGLLTPAGCIVTALILFGCSDQSVSPRVSSKPVVSPIAGVESSLPEYARPRGRILNPSDYDGSDVIGYRTLTRSDFKGVEPPPDMLPYRDRLGATTCAYIVTTPQTRVLVQPIQTPGGLRYDAIPENLGFQAQMDRSCSWWNPEPMSLEPSYILEHEQIHLALFELEARRLNAEAGSLTLWLKSTDATIEGARRSVQSRLERMLAQSLERVLARSRAFDEETSMGYRPERQKAWLHRVEAELSRPELAF
jgi:hypothetical protein